MSETLRSEIQNVANDHGIRHIVGRYIFEDIVSFEKGNSFGVALLSGRGLLPTREQSDKKIVEQKERQRVADEQEQIKEEQRKKSRQVDLSLLEEALSIPEVDIGTESGIDWLSELMSKIADRRHMGFILQERIRERISESDVSKMIADILLDIRDFNVLTITKFQKDGTTFWHLPPTDRSIRLKEGEGGELSFSYTDGLAPGRHVYFLRHVITGLDGSAMEFIGTLSRDSEVPNWGPGPGVLRIYTDLSYFKIFATPLEQAILMQLMSTTGDDAHGVIIQTDDSGSFQKIMRQRADVAMRRSGRGNGVSAFQYSL